MASDGGGRVVGWGGTIPGRKSESPNPAVLGMGFRELQESPL